MKLQIDTTSWGVIRSQDEKRANATFKIDRMDGLEGSLAARGGERTNLKAGSASPALDVVATSNRATSDELKTYIASQLPRSRDKMKK